ncbi:MAG TPA: molybdopterin-binding protein [Alphaproteobacteria bacterium]|nr:molybdopterin-binding protein [Alphaproteobacteria bacterium]
MNQPVANPTAAVLIIGNEILSGRVNDENLPFIAKRLADTGIDLKEVRMVRDEEPAIIEAVRYLSKTYTYLFTTGGIGPTHDDITVGAIAAAVNQPIERNAEVVEKLKLAAGSRTTEATFKMADYPANARLVPNGATAAPGAIVNNIIVLAGIPRIMQAMFEAALPLLVQGTPTHTLSVDIWLSESQIAAGLTAIQQRFPTLDIGSYPYKIDGRHGTALVARGTDQPLVAAAFGAIQKLVDDLGGERR